MSAFGQLVGPGVPDPQHYTDWKEWARDLGQLMQTSQVQTVTQAYIENLLNYRVGPWTPTLIGGTTPGTYSLAPGNSARYVRIASLVTVSMEATITVSSPGTGDIEIGGLPFSMLADSIAIGTLSLDSVMFPQQMFSYATGDVVTIRGMGSTLPIGVLDVGGLVTGSVIGLAMSYLTNP